jgi:hypothetical protein
MIAKFDLLKEHCHMAGDKASDVFAGINAQINAVQIATNEDAKTSFLESPESKNIIIFPSLLEFSNWLLAEKDAIPPETKK